MDAKRKPISNLEDIRAIELQPYEDVVPLRTTQDIFLRSAQLFPDRPALIQLLDEHPETPPRTFTYAELLANINRAANLFRSLGVRESNSVGLMLPSLPETHFALWGAQLAGRVCPINFMLSIDHIAELLHAADVKVLVALGPSPDFDIHQKALELRKSIPGLQVLFVNSGGDDAFEIRLAEQSGTLVFARDLVPADIASYFHTGGTTGAPKLALHTHANEVHTSWFAGLYYEMAEGDVAINGFPLFHVAGTFVFGAAAFCAGATIMLPPPLGMRHRGFIRNYWRFVEMYRVAFLVGVPTVLAALLDTPIGNADISSAKVFYTGGSPLPTELANVFERTTGLPVRNILGMTESAGLVSIEPLGAPRVALSCGLPLPFTEVTVIRVQESALDMNKRCAVGESGIVALRGVNVSLGYSDPARNAGMFEPGGWLVSGDLGHIDAEGRVFVTGRSKDLIIRGAHNIDPSMIEEAFVTHPDVISCAAVGSPDPHAGELPVVFVLCRQGSTATAEEILSQVAPQIAEPAAVPKRVTLLETMPTTAVGKIYKPRLRLMAMEQVFGDALSPLAEQIKKIEGHETSGGLSIDITLSDDVFMRATVEQQIKERLGRLAVRYRVV